MPRTNRLVIPGYPHHVVVRGNNRRRLFSYPNEYRWFALEVAQALEKAACLLHQLTLMTNHIHLIVTPEHEFALGQFVRHFAQRYAQIRNKTRDASGKLFEERYWSSPLVETHKLGLATVYNDLNPLRAGLVEDPVDYRWSTYALHAGRPLRCALPHYMFTPNPWYLSLGPDDATRARFYVEWTNQYRGENDCYILSQRSSDAHARYSKRLLRPNGTSAREAEPPPYGRVTIASNFNGFSVV